jgi:peptidoglycan/LPS O-acetylase OafA/YrhL
VRGLAISAVFLYHAVRGLPHVRPHEQFIHAVANAGWIGVDLFFVLSGFLITRILLEAKGQAAYFRNFYSRRVLRIVPLYLTFIVLVLYVVPALGLASPDDATQLRAAAPWYWAHAVNLMVAWSGWKSAAWYTGHLWSLGLEEQFYLLWPALVLMLTRRGLLRLSLGLMAGATLLRPLLLALHVSPTAVYVLLPTRMDTLAAGALLAIVGADAVSWARLRRYALPAGAAAAFVLAGVIYQESGLRSETPLTQVVGYPMLTTLAAVVIINAAGAAQGTLTSVFWNNAVLRFLGRYSYGLYVWHHVVIPLLSDHVLPDSRLPVVGGSYVPAYVLFTALALGTSLAAAMGSWWLIEAPFLRMKRLLPDGSGAGRRRRAVWHEGLAARLSEYRSRSRTSVPSGDPRPRSTPT